MNGLSELLFVLLTSNALLQPMDKGGGAPDEADLSRTVKMINPPRKYLLLVGLSVPKASRWELARNG